MRVLTNDLSKECTLLSLVFVGGMKLVKQPSYFLVGSDTGYPHDGRADNAAYRHDRPADKRRYRHDREIDIQMLNMFRNRYILS